MYVGMYVCFLFYPMGYNSIYLFKLDAQTGPDLATGSIFKMVSVFFWQAYHFFFLSNFLLSAIIRYSRHIFHFLCSRPRFSPFSKESLFFWVENGIECATYASLRVIMAPTGMANTYIENV